MDSTLFRFINTSLTNSIFDAIFPFITNIHHTDLFRYLLLPVLLGLLFWARRLTGFSIGALGVCSVWAADELISKPLKTVFNRTRPYDAEMEVILRIAKPSGASFPSGHSFDSFFLAAFFACYFPKARVWFFAFASLIAFSRVYNGVHYPGDVAGGALLGCACGFACAQIFARLIPRLKRTA